MKINFNKLFLIVLFTMGLCLASCTKDQAPGVKVYAWTNSGRHSNIDSLTAQYAKLKSHGIIGICNGAGDNPEMIAMAAKAAHANGMEYHAWHVTMRKQDADSTWYAVNRNGDSAYDVQAYVPRYKFLCPNKDEVYNYLVEIYTKIAEIPEVDYVHFDFIRFPDVILPRGLWEKYGLVMDEEYPVADYCYCDACVNGFKETSGIDIRAYDDPSTCQEWKQYRYDLITNLVNRLTDVIHAQGKKVSAAVFPGPELAKALVRQEWNKWNVDAFFPMNYNDFYLEGADWLRDITKEEVEAVAGKAPVYSGLFICRDWENKADIKDPEGHGLLPSEMEEAIDGSMESGASGICLFTPGRMTDAHWAVFDKAIRKKRN